MHISEMSWPPEAVAKHADDFQWRDRGSNCALDFHGDPFQARLTVLSDGNHHMALEQALTAFAQQSDEVDEIFYVTLPPGVLQPILEQQSLRLGNLRLSILPQILIGPQGWLERLAEAGQCRAPRPFARSLGNSLLVRRGNPLQIKGVADLYRDDVRLFVSNPVREKASHSIYRETLAALAEAEGLEPSLLLERLERGLDGIVHGEHVHHREAPAAVHSKEADVAVLYDHLALRFERIFPDTFERIPLPGAGADPVDPAQKTTTYGIARAAGSEDSVADALCDHFRSSETMETYEFHGLAPA